MKETDVLRITLPGSSGSPIRRRFLCLSRHPSHERYGFGVHCRPHPLQTEDNEADAAELEEASVKIQLEKGNNKA
jgi:hypothetical protein